MQTPTSRAAEEDMFPAAYIGGLVALDLPGGSACLLDPGIPFWIPLSAEEIKLVRCSEGAWTPLRILSAVSSKSGTQRDAVANRLVTFALAAEAVRAAAEETCRRPDPEGNGRITGLYMEVTGRCNLECVHCYSASGDSRATSELSTKQIAGVMKEALNAGASSITISGGEPFLRADIAELLAYGNSLGLDMGVVTNATLVTRRVAHLLDELGVSIQVSIDGSTDVIHDRIRGAGSFTAVRRGLDELLQRGLANRVTLSTCLMQQNAHDLDNIVSLALSLGIPRLDLIFVSRQGRAAMAWDRVGLHSEALVDLAKHIFDLSQDLQNQLQIENELTSGVITTLLVGGRNTEFRCSVCRAIRVDWKGDIFPCPFFDGLENCLGRVQDGPLDMILAHSRRRREILDAKLRRLELIRCVWRAYCGGGCMAEASRTCSSTWTICSDCKVRPELYKHVLSRLMGTPAPQCTESQL